MGAMGGKVERSWAGLWPGSVVSIADPNKTARVQVRVPAAYGSSDEEGRIPDSDLPWAIPCMSGIIHTPKVGDGVWVGFWNDDPEWPVWLGRFLTPTDRPAAFTSSCSPDPKTKIIETSSGHTIEMRWVDGDERVTIATRLGSSVSLTDITGVGPKIEATTPAGRKLTVDDTLQRASVETPTQKVELLDLTGTINIQATGAVNITAAGQLNLTGAGIAQNSSGPATSNATGTSTSTFTGAKDETVTGSKSDTVSGTYTMTCPTISMGSAAAVPLVTAEFIDLFNTHTHASQGSPPAIRHPQVSVKQSI